MGDVLLGISRQRHKLTLFCLGGQGITDPTVAGRCPYGAMRVRREAIVKPLPAGNDGQACLVARLNWLVR